MTAGSYRLNPGGHRPPLLCGCDLSTANVGLTFFFLLHYHVAAGTVSLITGRSRRAPGAVKGAPVLARRSAPLTARTRDRSSGYRRNGSKRCFGLSVLIKNSSNIGLVAR